MTSGLGGQFDKVIERVAVGWSINSKDHTGPAMGRRGIQLATIAPDRFRIIDFDREGGEIGVVGRNGHAVEGRF